MASLLASVSSRTTFRMKHCIEVLNEHAHLPWPALLEQVHIWGIEELDTSFLPFITNALTEHRKTQIETLLVAGKSSIDLFIYPGQAVGVHSSTWSALKNALSSGSLTYLSLYGASIVDAHVLELCQLRYKTPVRIRFHETSLTNRALCQLFSFKLRSIQPDMMEILFFQNTQLDPVVCDLLGKLNSSIIEKKRDQLEALLKKCFQKVGLLPPLTAQADQ